VRFKLLLALVLLSCVVVAQQKVRTPVPEAATRCGSEIPWRASLEDALAEAQKSGRPVFWYVPTVAGSRMDRKPVLDMYMLSGPFSMPTFSTLIARRCIAVKAVAKGERAEALGLKPLAFIEPGFVVLKPDGTLVGLVQKLSTFHEGWLLLQLNDLLAKCAAPASREVSEARAGGDAQKLARALLEEGAFEAALAELTKAPADAATALLFARALMELGRDDEAVAALAIATKHSALPREVQALRLRHALLRGDPESVLGIAKEARGASKLQSTPVAHEAALLSGVVLRLCGEDALAGETFNALASAEPEDLWTRKAAAEATRYGPFSRGFEVFSRLPSHAMQVSTDGTRVACREADAPALARASVELLLRTQRTDGSWDDSNYDFGGTDSLPNVYAAGTAIAALALHRARSVDPLRCDAAVAKALRWLSDSEHYAAEDKDEILWAHSWHAEVLAALRGTKHVSDAAMRKASEALLAQELKGGGFRHEYANPFATASALLALDHLRVAGVRIPKDLLRSSAEKLAASRGSDGTFSYNFARKGGSAPEFSAGRSPVCEAALLTQGFSDQSRLLAAIQLAEQHHANLEQVRKYDDHADRFGNGGFFFWYALHGRLTAIEALTDVKARTEAKARLRALVLALPEIDFGFVDSHELGKSYGTAMGLICLLGTEAEQL
jgi:hypothetical protein